MVFAFAVPASPQAPARVRSELRERLRETLGPRMASDLELLLSEVVTNAVRYGGMGGQASIEVEIRIDNDLVSAQITDSGRGFVPDQPPTPRVERSPGGFGLYLLDLLSTRWGVERNETGFRVWFRLAR
jgi:anti-sigma regulatory factor (Ser/Thr protein kinase)